MISFIDKSIQVTTEYYTNKLKMFILQGWNLQSNLGLDIFALIY